MAIPLRLACAAACAVRVACPTTPTDAVPPRPPDEPFGRFVAHTLPETTSPAEVLKAAGLPANPDGSVSLPGSGLAFGDPPNDAITAKGRCLRWVTTCLGTRTAEFVADADDCVRSVPRCQTNEPWNEAPCCPQACVTAYMQQRAAGTAPAPAFVASFSGSDCHPGVRALLERSR